MGPDRKFVNLHSIVRFETTRRRSKVLRRTMAVDATVPPPPNNNPPTQKVSEVIATFRPCRVRCTTLLQKLAGLTRL